MRVCGRARVCVCEHVSTLTSFPLTIPIFDELITRGRERVIWVVWGSIVWVFFPTGVDTEKSLEVVLIVVVN